MRVAQLLLIVVSGLALAGVRRSRRRCPMRSERRRAGRRHDRTAPSERCRRARLSAEQRGARSRRSSAGTIVYFDYDRAEIKPEYVPIVAAHAKFLNGNATRKVRLEGHSDERGSREYNIGLGERRAQAVRRALMLQGVTEAQITTVSYGEERPAVQGGDETAYAKNRRVELVYGR